MAGIRFRKRFRFADRRQDEPGRRPASRAGPALVAAGARRARHQHRSLQRAEGRYRLMPGVIRALAESGTPFSILTKGTLLRRDIPLLAESAQRVPVGL